MTERKAEVRELQRLKALGEHLTQFNAESQRGKRSPAQRLLRKAQGKAIARTIKRAFPSIKVEVS